MVNAAERFLGGFFGSGHGGEGLEAYSQTTKQTSNAVAELAEMFGAYNITSFDKWIKTTEMSKRGTYPKSDDKGLGKGKGKGEEKIFQQAGNSAFDKEKAKPVLGGGDSILVLYSLSAEEGYSQWVLRPVKPKDPTNFGGILKTGPAKGKKVDLYKTSK